MKLTSPAFENNSSIPAKYTCDGANINPPLAIADVPAAAKSLVLIMDDPDVPTTIRPDGTWDHWLVWNIDPAVDVINEGREPNGIIGLNTGGRAGYGGPCPPDREHRYFFKLYALDVVLQLSPDIGKKTLQTAMVGHIIEQAQLVGRYNRH